MCGISDRLCLIPCKDVKLSQCAELFFLTLSVKPVWVAWFNVCCVHFNIVGKKSFRTPYRCSSEPCFNFHPFFFPCCSWSRCNHCCCASTFSMQCQISTTVTGVQRISHCYRPNADTTLGVTLVRKDKEICAANNYGICQQPYSCFVRERMILD